MADLTARIPVAHATGTAYVGPPGLKFVNSRLESRVNPIGPGCIRLSVNSYDSFTCLRFRRRPLELEGRWPWLALVSLRLVFAMVCVPDYFHTSVGVGRIHIDTV